MNNFRQVLILAGTTLAGVAVGGGAFAANCTDGAINQTNSPDFSAYSIIFDQFVASVADPASCNLSVPLNPLGPGVIAVYSADYRGFVDFGTASLTVAHNGVMDGVVTTTPDDIALRDFVASNGNSLDSSITLALIDFSDPGAQATLSSIDYLEVGRTTIGAVQASIADQAIGQTALITDLRTTADLLNGLLDPVERPTEVGVFGALGSATFGVDGHFDAGNGFSVTGGGAAFTSAPRFGTVTGLLFSGSVRYMTPESDAVRPYAEIGATAAPTLGLTFSRSYADGSAAGATATRTTTGNLYGGYLEGGLVLAPVPGNEVAVFASLGENWLNLAASTETFSAGSLFPASFAASTSRYTTVKAGLSWTTAATEQLDLTLTGSLGQTIAHDPVVANVTFVGPVAIGGQSEFFGQYGAKLGWAVNESTKVEAFALGTTGQVSGTHLQVGTGVHFRF